jgi:hypothetical protein
MLLLNNFRGVRFAHFETTQSDDRPAVAGYGSLQMTLASGEEPVDLVVALRLYSGRGDMRYARRRF